MSSSSHTVVNMGDIIATIVTLGFGLIPILVIIFIYRAYKKHAKRAEERLNIEKQQTFQLQKQVEQLNTRVESIEKLLKEVD